MSKDAILKDISEDYNVGCIGLIREQTEVILNKFDEFLTELGNTVIYLVGEEQVATPSTAAGKISVQIPSGAIGRITDNCYSIEKKLERAKDILTRLKQS